MRIAAILAAPLLLLGCAAEDAETASTAAGIGAGQVACIDAGRIAGRRAESNRALVFELSDGRTLRNDLPQACPGLERASQFGTLAVDPIESRMCRGDFVRIYDPADLPVGGIKSLPRCRLGTYTIVPRG